MNNIMLRNYLLISSHTDDHLKYEALKFELLKSIVILLSCIGIYRIFLWLQCVTIYIHGQIWSNSSLENIIRKRKSTRIKRNVHINHERDLDEDDAAVTDPERILDFRSMRIPNSPSPESIMGIAAAAATAASVFIEKKRDKERDEKLCAKCHVIKPRQL